VVHCSTQQWEEHVCDHKEMVGHEDLVKRTIDDPFAVYQSAHPRRQVFYRPSELPAPYHRGFIRVVVDYSLDWRSRESGFVVTAFHCTGVKQNEVIIWPKN
jgi:hypothetical protein